MKRVLAAQVGETEPFISELLTGLTGIIQVRLLVLAILPVTAYRPFPAFVCLLLRSASCLDQIFLCSVSRTWRRTRYTCSTRPSAS